jgi:hypothetical protein
MPRRILAYLAPLVKRHEICFGPPQSLLAPAGPAPERSDSAYHVLAGFALRRLVCHGGPKGEKDITGGKKEGGKPGDLGGAISGAIYLR